MSEPKRSPAESLPWVPLATLLAGVIAGGWLAFQPPLISSRPNIAWPAGEREMSMQDVDARLWQDPLQPLVSITQHQFANAAAQGPASPYDSRTHSIDELLKKFSQESDKKRLVLAVMVNGSGYAEKVERRLRDRVAVENALERAGYSPKDADHLGYFTIPWPRSAADWFEPSEYRSGNLWDCQNDPECTFLTVPFEEHKPDRSKGDTKWDKILVLWLRQDFFEDKPLTRLAKFLSVFRNINGNSCDVRILGPDTSESLLSIVDEVRAGKISDQVTTALEGVKMFAFRPSASDQILLGTPAKPGDVATRIRQGCPGLEFYRTTTTDDILLKAVKKELRRRNIRLWSTHSHSRLRTFLGLGVRPSDTIATVSEYDTLFGRAYQATLVSVLCGDTSSPWYTECREHMEQLSYLRGIDGRTPVRQIPSAYISSGTGPSPTPGSGTYNTKRPYIAGELPEGTDQSDYIRRLARRISSLDDSHRSLDDRFGSRGITAIGVLGSDVYDKLEILHALRSRLRAKLFFTTGLDARFYHADELNATRNLVVVSGFGLQLHGYYQGPVPPFRDHNQTAAFASALCALDFVEDPSRFVNSKPRIYEITTDGPIDLSVDKRSDLDELRKLLASPEKKPTNIHPGRPDLEKWWQKNNKTDWTNILYRLSAFVVLIGSIGFAGYYVWGPRTHTATTESNSGEQPNQHPLESYQASLFVKSTVLAIACSMLLIVFFLAILYYDQRLEGEPFNLFASGSMWPTEGIRLLVIFLSIHFVVKSVALLKENSRNEIEHSFELAGESRPPWRQLLETIWIWKHYRKPVIKDLWNEYRVRDSLSCRLGWTAFWCFCYGIVLLCLWRVSRHPILPVRGHQIVSLDQWVNVLSMAATTFLTVFVAYATGLDARFAVLLSNGKTTWPAEVRKRYQFSSDKRAGWTDFNGEYLDVFLIARRTRAVTRLIYYPFITISLLILCRLPQFDNFDWSPLLTAFFSFNIIVSCACVFVLRRVAEKVRRDSLERLRDKLRQARAVGANIKRKAIETTIAEVEKLDTGIFAPIARQPVIGALLLPFGSAGISALLQYLH